MIREIALHNIDVRLNTEATPEFIKEFGADCVIIATGSVPSCPPIPGIEHAHQAMAVYDGTIEAGKKVVMIGGGLVGCETGLFLQKTGHEVRVTVPGHMQRGGAPDPYDRVFASRLGAEAGQLILNKEYGFMVAYKNREIVKVPLSEIAGKLKYVSPDANIIKEAKMLGVCFGD